MKKELLALALNGWVHKQLLKFYLHKDSTPVTGFIVAFGKSGFITHFDILSVIEVNKVRTYSAGERYDLNHSQKVVDIPLKDIYAIIPTGVYS